MRKQIILLSTLAVLSIGALAAVPFAASTLAGNEPAQRVATVKTATFVVENMTCAACPITVRAAMSGVEGVSSVKVNFLTKTALVVFDPAKTNVDAIAAASTNAGYPAKAQEKAKAS